MNNSVSDDYFSFMSEKGDAKNSERRSPGAALAAHAAAVGKAFDPTDTISFEEESQIEVIEGFASDTMIQRIFKRWGSES